LLKTTYKTRCLNGLENTHPTSTQACHRPARGNFSKYCSDECGINNMRRRIEGWSAQGGKKDRLWESVKDAEKREAVVMLADTTADDGKAFVKNAAVQFTAIKSVKSKVTREGERLQGLLTSITNLREELKSGMDVIAWRERLLDLAAERAEAIGHCGWDQRLCFGEEEWSEFGEGALDSYADYPQHAMDTDEEWWCVGEKQCTRHSG